MRHCTRQDVQNDSSLNTLYSSCQSYWGSAICCNNCQRTNTTHSTLNELTVHQHDAWYANSQHWKQLGEDISDNILSVLTVSSIYTSKQQKTIQNIYSYTQYGIFDNNCLNISVCVCLYVYGYVYIYIYIYIKWNM